MTIAAVGGTVSGKFLDLLKQENPECKFARCGSLLAGHLNRPIDGVFEIDRAQGVLSSPSRKFTR